MGVLFVVAVPVWAGGAHAGRVSPDMPVAAPAPATPVASKAASAPQLELPPAGAPASAAQPVSTAPSGSCPAPTTAADPWALAATPSLPVNAAAAVTRAALVVEPEWLAAHSGDPRVVILQVGDATAYAARHLPGARYVSPSQDLAVSGPAAGGLTLEMPPADELRQRLEGLGIFDGAHVVVAFGKDELPAATRVLFVLDAAGIAGSLLDGGLEAWARAGQPVSTEPVSPATGHLAPFALKPLVVDEAYVRRHLGSPGIALVDARDPAFYDGTKRGGPAEHPHRAGHIRGAVSVPFSALLDTDLRLRPAGQLAALFANAGVREGDTIVTYCHTGQQASATLFAARTLGFATLLYDGSFEDWSAHPDDPVDDPASAVPLP